MYEDLVTTKMDLFIDEEYWVEKGKEEINLASSVEPENEGFFSFILRLVRPGVDKANNKGEKYFDEFIRNYPMHSFQVRVYRKGEREGFIQFINKTDGKLDIAQFSKIIMLFFLKNFHEEADLCFLCKDIESGIVFPDHMDVIPLRLGLENIYEDGRKEYVMPRGRLVLINIGFPNSLC